MTRLIFRIFLILITLDLHAQVGREWVKTYHGTGSYAVGNDVTTDGSGNLYVTGAAIHTGTGLDYVTVKYSSSGVQQWLKTFDGPGNSSDMASFIRTDASGDIIVAGTSESSGENPDFAVIKYNSLGEQQWIQRYDGGGHGYGGDNVKGIELDTYGNIYVTGTSAGISTSNDIVIIKYAPAGSLLWIIRYNFSDDQASAIKADNSGNVYISGCSLISGSMGYTLLKYNSAGSLLWVRNYNSAGFNDDRTTALSIDNQGNIIVTGFSVTGGTGYDYATIKYNPAGEVQWMKVYDGPAGSTETPVSLAIDNANNVYVSGSSVGLGTQSDAATVKYNSDGDQLWVRRYDGQAHSNDYVNDMVLDGAGNIYIASTCNFYTTFADFNILKYDAAGNLIWSRAYGGNAYQDDEVKSIISDNKGNIFVCGKTIDSTAGGIFCTAKYTESVFHDIEMGRFVNFPVQFIVNNTYNLKAYVYNNGSSAEPNFQIKWVINGNIIDASNISVNSGFEDTVSRFWTPHSAGTYEVKYISALPDDIERNNDTIIQTIRVIEMPTQTSSINICRSGLNKWIPNNSSTPLYDTIYIDIPNSIGVIDVNVVIDTILHPRVSDLEISLKHFQVTDSLITRRGPGSNFINTILNDSAAADISQGSAPFSSTFRPESPLTAFNGVNLNGAWVLKISDHAAGETGFLKSWCLQIKYQLVTGIIENENIPNEFILEQNFPNPFNPKTKIKFGVPATEKATNVRLIIYDILGREAAILANEKLSPGLHEIEWDASNYASGVYYCILEAGMHRIGRKMVLIK